MYASEGLINCVVFIFFLISLLCIGAGLKGIFSILEEEKLKQKRKEAEMSKIDLYKTNHE